MTLVVEYLSNMATGSEIAEHLLRCDADFVPSLSNRVKITDYAQKIAENAMRFEAWSGGTLVGLVACYCNDPEKLIAYITSVSVLKEWTGNGIAARLMSRCIEHAKVLGMRQISLAVAAENTPAIRLYENNGFAMGTENASFVAMDLKLKNGEEG